NRGRHMPGDRKSRRDARTTVSVRLHPRIAASWTNANAAEEPSGASAFFRILLTEDGTQYVADKLSGMTSVVQGPPACGHCGPTRPASPQPRHREELESQCLRPED